MPTVPYQPADLREPQELVGAIRARRGGRLLNLDRMLLHSPELAAGWNTFLGTVRNALSVPGHLRELAICAVAVLNKADYEFIQHAPEYIEAGGPAEKLELLKKLDDRDFGRQAFSEREQAVLKLTVEMTRSVQVSEATMHQARKAFDNHRQLVELVGIIAAYNMVSRFLVALDIEPE
jgi:alkylhydroperoxidase family enzyme